MEREQVNERLTFQLRNIALYSFAADHDYEDIISPYTRIYSIINGTGYIIIGNSRITLEEGFLYIIPSYTSCTYHFDKGLVHIFIHASIDFDNGLSPYNVYSIKYKVALNDLDPVLFKRILSLNPDMELPHHHPNVYQTKLWLNKKVSYTSPAHYLETNGILQQLFSRFIEPQPNHAFTNILKYNIQPILLYIQNNLHQEITVESLANIACFSKDHFAKVFKSILALSPIDYVIKKRIERAQFLLMTTELSQNEIIEQVGFKSVSYFSRIFKKSTGYSPDKYRKQKG